MKKIFFLACLAAGLLSTACTEFADENDIPTGGSLSTFTAQSMAPANTTIAKLKTQYKSAIQNGSFERISEDLIFEGVVAANDISGNLYQTLVVRDGDDAIIVAINDYSLYSHFPVGTRIRVNMNGLYMGGYGKLPKIGCPYITSSGNKRQGPMSKPQAAKNVYKDSFDADAPEVTPLDIDESWLKTADKDKYAPMLVRLSDVEIHTMVNNKTKERCPYYATSEFEDQGFGVNDTIVVGRTKLLFRCSTSATFAFDKVPTGAVDVVGVLTRYNNDWQFQIREGNDVTGK